MNALRNNTTLQLVALVGFGFSILAAIVIIMMGVSKIQSQKQDASSGSGAGSTSMQSSDESVFPSPPPFDPRQGCTTFDLEYLEIDVFLFTVNRVGVVVRIDDTFTIIRRVDENVYITQKTIGGNDWTYGVVSSDEFETGIRQGAYRGLPKAIANILNGTKNKIGSLTKVEAAKKIGWDGICR